MRIGQRLNVGGGALDGTSQQRGKEKGTARKRQQKISRDVGMRWEEMNGQNPRDDEEIRQVKGEQKHVRKKNISGR